MNCQTLSRCLTAFYRERRKELWSDRPQKKKSRFIIRSFIRYRIWFFRWFEMSAFIWCWTRFREVCPWTPQHPFRCRQRSPLNISGMVRRIFRKILSSGGCWNMRHFPICWIFRRSASMPIFCEMTWTGCAAVSCERKQPRRRGLSYGRTWPVHEKNL